MREELILRPWNIVGDDETSSELLSQEWLTEHTVVAVGGPLLRKGASALDENARLRARIRVPGRSDVKD